MNIVNSWKRLTVFGKRFNLDIWQSSEYLIYCSFVAKFEIFFFFFFLSGFSFTNIHDSRDSRGRGHLDISRVITAESSPLHIAGSRTRTGILWFPSASRSWVGFKLSGAIYRLDLGCKLNVPKMFPKCRGCFQEENFAKVTKTFWRVLSKKLRELNVTKIWKSKCRVNLKLWTADKYRKFF